MREFGWYQSVCLSIDAEAFNVWGTWTSILERGVYEDGDAAPYAPLSSSGDRAVIKSLQQCMDVARREGHYAHDLIDWIGYSIGIAWCSKKPKFSEKIERYLDENFPWELMIRHPYDYLSSFLAENGSSGNLDYYPTPLSVTNNCRTLQIWHICE